MDFGLLQGTVEIEDSRNFLSVIRRIAEEHRTTIQVIDTGRIAGMQHISTAVEKAVNSVRDGRNITKDLGMEILLYASGQRQIEKALRMGISEGENEVAFVIVPKNDAAAEAIRVATHIENRKNVDYSSDKREEIMKFFNITEEEVKAVGVGPVAVSRRISVEVGVDPDEKISQLVCERVVLLDVMK
jgi:KEOPS complex subunit Cgi121